MIFGLHTVQCNGLLTEMKSQMRSFANISNEDLLISTAPSQINRGSRPPQMTSTVPRHHDLAERTCAIDGPILAHKSCAPPTNLDAGELFQDFCS